MRPGLLLSALVVLSLAPRLDARFRGPLPPPVSPAGVSDAGEDPAEPDDAALRRIWRRLSDEDKAEVSEWFAAELRWLETFQLKLARFVLRGQDVDPGTWPAAEEAVFFDPADHAPRAARRKRLAPDSKRVERQRERFFRKFPEERIQRAFRYDYGARGLVVVDDPSDPDRVFENALAGFAPYHDLVEALVERALDDGAQQKELAAFDHAYTDRDGRVYGELRLYDAWASGSSMEMPDVDCLGIIHSVLDDRTTWKAPVPAGKQRALYDRIARMFKTAHRYRSLRHALARTYLGGSVPLRDGYAVEVDRLHTLWEEHASTPAQLASFLPGPDDYGEFLDAWGRMTDKHPDKLAKGVERRATLDQGSAEVRGTLARVLLDFQAQRSANTKGGVDQDAGGR